MIPSQLKTNAACPNFGINLNSITLALVLNLDTESEYIRDVQLTESLGCLVFFEKEVENFSKCVARGDLNLQVV